MHGPNKDAKAVKFYCNLSKLLRNDELGNEENITIGGDYNCPLDITLDKKGGLPISRHCKALPGGVVHLLYFAD